MPCYDPRDREDAQHACEGMAACCELIQWLERNGVLRPDQLPSAVHAWWLKHKARDDERAAERRFALAFTIADIGKQVRIIATNEHGRVWQVHPKLIVFTDAGYSYHDDEDLERGHFVQTWVPEP